VRFLERDDPHQETPVSYSTSHIAQTAGRTALLTSLLARQQRRPCIRSNETLSFTTHNHLLPSSCKQAHVGAKVLLSPGTYSTLLIAHLRFARPTGRHTPLNESACFQFHSGDPLVDALSRNRERVSECFVGFGVEKSVHGTGVGKRRPLLGKIEPGPLAATRIAVPDAVGATVLAEFWQNIRARGDSVKERVGALPAPVKRPLKLVVRTDIVPE
jgi:hypothetical protein